MKANPRNSFLWWALGLSCAVHLVFGYFVPLVRNQIREQAAQSVSLTPLRLPTPSPPTPEPKNTPPPVRATQMLQKPRVSPRVVRLSSESRGSAVSRDLPWVQPSPGGENGGSNGIATAAPTSGAATAPPATPLPTQRPSCAIPNREAATTRAVQPETPEIAAQQGAVGVAQIKVTLSAAGAVQAVSVYASTGNAALDRAALAAARASSYAPAVEDCIPIAGTYLYRVEFSGQ